jgi:diaminopimelate epimerase
MLVDTDNNVEFSAEEIRQITDRHFGIGSDGLIRVGSHNGNYFMDYYNADGSTAQMCGNGVRATVALIEHFGLHNFALVPELALETRAGVKFVTKTSNGHYRVDMGAWQAPVASSKEADVFVKLPPVVGEPLQAYFVDMGNEHLVSPMCPEHFDALCSQMPQLEQPVFEAISPSSATDLATEQTVSRLTSYGTNFEFVTVDAVRKAIRMRVYERGVGETLSCGTGICASAVVAHLQSSAETPSQWRVSVPGGQLTVEVQPDTVYLTGPARIVGEFKMF